MKHSFHIQSKQGRRILAGLISAMILLPMTSCEDFLNTESSYFSDSTLDNPSDTLYSVVGIINKLQSLSDRTILLGELRGDLSDVTDGANSDLLEIAMFNVSDNNQYNAPHDYYAVINNCNYYLANVDTEMKNNRNEYVFRKEYAVVKAYRAWTYLQLALNYGKVPLVTEPILTQEQADRDYPKMGIEDICQYFIEDLQGLETIGVPGYGTIRNTDSRLFYFPIYVLLGDLHLWAGNYKEAAMNYYSYLNTRNGANVGAPINTNFTRWSADNLRWEVKTSMSGGSGEKYNAQTELVTMFPGDSIPSESQYSRLNDYFNSNQNNDNKVSITASQKLRDLSAAQVYCHMTSASNIIYPPATLEGLDRGDLRLTTNFTEIQRANSTVSLSNKLVTNEKHTSRNVRLYRRTMVYLRMAEALNRAGYPRFAFKILQSGVNNSVIENEVIPFYSEADAAWLRQFNFPNNQYVLRTKAEGADENTYGIHSNGSGWTEYNEYYVFPDDSTLTAEARLAYQIEKVEDLIMDEEALEFAFEGHRYYDLMRVALRRGEPAYLADHVYARRGASHEAEMRSFITKDLTDVNNWYISWNGELGINY